MQHVTPCLWFDTQAEEAARFYTSIFPKSKILGISYYGEGMPLPKGTVLTVQFQLQGEEYLALNGGPAFKFTEAISLIVNCKTQKEIDRYWAKLTDGGQEVECGWLKDRYGLSWQVVPAELSVMLKSKDTRKVDRMIKAVLTMKKLDLAKLKAAFKG